MGKVGDLRLGASLGRALLVLPLVLLASCGGGSGSITSRQAASGPQTTPTPPAPAPKPGWITSSETVRPLPAGHNTQASAPINSAETANQLQQDDPCFTTAGGGCLSKTKLNAKAPKLAAAFKAKYHKTFKGVWGENASKAYWGLDMINYDKALAHLRLARGRSAAKNPGKNVTIGFIDSGIHTQHAAFALKSKRSLKERFQWDAVNEDPNKSSHGTHVAGIAAGRYGVASSANIKMFAIPLRESSDGTAPPITLNQLSATDYSYAQLYERAVNNLNDKIDILNLSINFSGMIENYSEQDLRANFGRSIKVLAQPNKHNKTIIVWAAGNTGRSSPEVQAGLVARIAELQGHSLAVVSVDTNGRISSFSNRCGIAAEFCIAAPGGSMIVADQGSGNGIWSVKRGTSLAAPYVSGSLAVMEQLFRGQLSNTQLVSRLLATAKDDGIYADTSIYGQGLLDLGAATNPWGFTSFITPRSRSQFANTNSCPHNSISTHPSLGLGCLNKEAFDEKIDTWAKVFGARKDFTSSWGLKAINAHRAYAHLKAIKGEEVKPGEGVTIGFLDTGIDEEHPSFENVNVTETLFWDVEDETGTQMSHGTAVASVAAGGRVSSETTHGNAHHGVAWGADVAMFAFPGYTDPPNRWYDPRFFKILKDTDDKDSKLFKAILNSIFNKDIDILNASITFGSMGIVEDYTESELRKDYRKTIAALTQARAKEKTILIWAAGNSQTRSCDLDYVDRERCNVQQGQYGTVNASSPQLMAGLPAKIEELRGHYIAAVAVKQEPEGQPGPIADFSNRCGIAADWCIAAPGQDVISAYFGPANGQSGARGFPAFSGTSFSAPMVAGGLAIMKQLFRDQLSNTELVSRLFATANKTGIYADRSIYGQGLMDLDAATNPWTIPAFIGTGQAAGHMAGGFAHVSNSGILLGQALGDGLPQALASQEIAAFDSLGAPFWYPASHFTVPAAGTSLATNLQRFLNPAEQSTLPDTWQFSFQEGATALEGGHLALSHGASRFSMTGPQGWGATLFQEAGALEGLSVAWNPQSFDDLTIQAGYLKEKQSLLGTQASGAFGQLSANTLFLQAGINTTAGGWQLAAQGELGHVIPSLGHSLLIDSVSPLTTSAFGLTATRLFDNGSRLSFSLRQPLRVERGTATFSLPTGRTRDGVVLGKTLSAPLDPRGRQLDLTVKLDVPLWGGDVSMGATRSQQPRHQLGAAPRWTVFTGYRSTY